MSMVSSLARNTSWFTVALVMQKVITFVYFMFLARTLGVELLGQFVFAMSYMTLFSIVVDFGTNHYITREVARDTTIAAKLFRNILGFKSYSSIIAIAVALGIAWLLGYDASMMRLIAVALVVMVFESLVLSLYAFMRGFHILKYESFGTVITQVIIAVLGFICMQFTANPMAYIIVLLVGTVWNVMYALWHIRKTFHIPLTIRWNVRYWKDITTAVLPFALAGGFAKVYGAFDQVMLSKLGTEVELGLYAVAYKLTFALQFLPMALMAAVYPAMSSYFFEKKLTALSALLTRTTTYLLVLTLPIILVVWFFGYQLIITVYTEAFAASFWPLFILILSLPLLFINFPLGSLLNAANKQRQQTFNIGTALLVNVILNSLLIPWLYATGAAVASAVSTIVLFIQGIYMTRNIITIQVRQILVVLAKSVLACLIAALVAMIFTTGQWMLDASVVFIVYLLVQLSLATVPLDELRGVLSSFRNKS